jgi:hypothetical protein
VGSYFGHRIRLAEEAGRWRILFDPIIGGVYGEDAERLGFIETPWDDDTTYETAEDAKRAALKLAQECSGSWGTDAKCKRKSNGELYKGAVSQLSKREGEEEGVGPAITPATYQTFTRNKPHPRLGLHGGSPGDRGRYTIPVRAKANTAIHNGILSPIRE